MTVLQPWVSDQTCMMQSVLIAAVRGPDGIRKNHVAKLLLRWYRRCVLLSAFDARILTTPWELGGGSFTGPSIPAPVSRPGFTGAQDWMVPMSELLKEYCKTLDELPHHFQLHFMHAAEILGYTHPDPDIQFWWNWVYLTLVNDMHLEPESKEKLFYRLGDSETSWRACEGGITADNPV
jgi:hypothetical protein